MGGGGIGKQGRGEGGKGGKDVKEKDETRVSEGAGKETRKGVEGLYISIPRVPQCLFLRPN
jgi:hypothetical protein